MKLILVAMNAKYIHTNLAVRSMAACCRAAGYNVEIAEYTINQSTDFILSRLYALRGDCYLFSGYIWNIGTIRRLGADLRQLLPRALLGVGGPETNYRGGEFLLENPAFDWVALGEGEELLPALLERLVCGKSLAKLPGLALREHGQVATTPPLPPPQLDALPFPYEQPEEGRILYYESSRGCPFSCGYCLSSVERGVRLRSLALVRADLRQFLDWRVPQVKFVDRTFNADRERALAIWRFLSEQDNGVTNFHFELSGELLDESSLLFLESVRPGLFQFEIGVQSTNPRTLSAIGRKGDFELLSEGVRRLRERGNIHLHLDLIAGLPFEGWESFASSFDLVHSLHPHQLQLGFLKVLSGSAMERQAGEWDLLYRREAPYEILQNRWLTFEQLEQLKGIAHMVELYCNSGRFTNTLRYVLEQFSSPFACYWHLWRFYRRQGCEEAPLSKVGYYDLLGDFLLVCGLEQSERVKWLCRLDLLLHEKPRRLPDWVDVDGTLAHRESIRLFYQNSRLTAEYLSGYVAEDSRRIARLTHLEAFPFYPDRDSEGPIFVLFDYRSRTPSGRARTLRFSLNGPAERVDSWRKLP